MTDTQNDAQPDYREPSRLAKKTLMPPGLEAKTAIKTDSELKRMIAALRRRLFGDHGEAA